MSVENWSENIIVVDLQDGPSFVDDLQALMDQLEARPDTHVVVSFSGIKYLNSSNIAKLLRLRKKLITNKRRLVLCAIDTSVWGLFLVTGLDKVFDFADDVASALASVQIPAE